MMMTSQSRGMKEGWKKRKKRKRRKGREEEAEEEEEEEEEAFASVGKRESEVGAISELQR